MLGNTNSYTIIVWVPINRPKRFPFHKSSYCVRLCTYADCRTCRNSWYRYRFQTENATHWNPIPNRLCAFPLCSFRLLVFVWRWPMRASVCPLLNELFIIEITNVRLKWNVSDIDANYDIKKKSTDHSRSTHSFESMCSVESNRKSGDSVTAAAAADDQFYCQRTRCLHSNQYTVEFS